MNLHDWILALASVWFIGGQLLAAASDAATMRIPNALILWLLGGFALTAALSQPDWSELAASAAVGLVILAGGMILFARGWMGGGDVKLLAVSSLWFGPVATPAFLILTALLGGLLTLGVVACHATGVRHLAGRKIAALRGPVPRVPYGIAIAMAAIALVFLQPGAVVPG